jgi:hypothetical protein
MDRRTSCKTIVLITSDHTHTRGGVARRALDGGGCVAGSSTPARVEVSVVLSKAPGQELTSVGSQPHAGAPAT